MKECMLPILARGSGAYVLAAAKRVGHSGRVYAIDVNKELLEKVKRDAIQKQ